MKNMATRGVSGRGMGSVGLQIPWVTNPMRKFWGRANPIAMISCLSRGEKICGMIWTTRQHFFCDCLSVRLCFCLLFRRYLKNRCSYGHQTWHKNVPLWVLEILLFWG